MPLSVSEPVPEPDAVRPEPVKPLADKLPSEIATMTVRAVELVPSAPAAKVICPLLVETVIADGKLKVGRLSAAAFPPVTVLTAIVLAAELPPLMPVLCSLRVTLTVPLPLALTLPAAR